MRVILTKGLISLSLCDRYDQRIALDCLAALVLLLVGHQMLTTRPSLYTPSGETSFVLALFMLRPKSGGAQGTLGSMMMRHCQPLMRKAEKRIRERYKNSGVKCAWMNLSIWAFETVRLVSCPQDKVNRELHPLSGILDLRLLTLSVFVFPRSEYSSLRFRGIMVLSLSDEEMTYKATPSEGGPTISQASLRFHGENPI